MKMGLFVTNKSNFKIVVNYVFDKEVEVHVISDDDIKKIEEEYSGEDYSEEGYPFNTPVQLKNYKKEDLKTATFHFRKPSFSDMPKMFSSMGEGLTNGEAFAFSAKRMEQLFVKGIAQDSKGRQATVDESNIGSLDTAMAGYLVVELANKLG
jgi:hypothetical protein